MKNISIDDFDLMKFEGRGCNGCYFDTYPNGCVGMAIQAQSKCNFGIDGVFVLKQIIPEAIITPTPEKPLSAKMKKFLGIA